MYKNIHCIVGLFFGVLFILATGCRQDVFIADALTDTAGDTTDDSNRETDSDTSSATEKDTSTDSVSDRNTETIDDTATVDSAIPDTSTDMPTDSIADTGTVEDTDSFLDSATNEDSESATNEDSESATETDSSVIPSAFSWESSPPLISKPSWAKWIKDPTAGKDGDIWHLYSTAALEETLVFSYIQVSDWNQINSEAQEFVKFGDYPEGYKASPQLFFFEPNQRWYLVYQGQDPSWTSTTTPGDPSSWHEREVFMPLMSQFDDENEPPVDYWIICDTDTCFMFFTALNGILYRAHTAKSDFPDGFEGSIVEVMQEDTLALLEGCGVYKIAGTDTYLLLIAGVGDSGRYYRAWTADALDGQWTPLATGETDAFASHSNVSNLDWTNRGIINGEILRENPDETMTINIESMQFIFSGEVTDTDNEEGISHQIGILTSTH